MQSQTDTERTTSVEMIDPYACRSITLNEEIFWLVKSGWYFETKGSIEIP